jgi:hyperosmotically inducible protein
MKRTLLLSLIVVLAGFVGFFYLSGTPWSRFPRVDRPAETGSANMEVAKERGAKVGEEVVIAAAKVKEEAGEAALTSKIKAKMLLDDNVKARAIDVTTNGSTVTLTGTVRSTDERDRAARLTRETAGVTRVVDQLRIEMK